MTALSFWFGCTCGATLFGGDCARNRRNNLTIGRCFAVMSASNSTVPRARGRSGKVGPSENRAALHDAIERAGQCALAWKRRETQDFWFASATSSRLTTPRMKDSGRHQTFAQALFPKSTMRFGSKSKAKSKASASRAMAPSHAFVDPDGSPAQSPASSASSFISVGVLMEQRERPERMKMEDLGDLDDALDAMSLDGRGDGNDMVCGEVISDVSPDELFEAYTGRARLAPGPHAASVRPTMSFLTSYCSTLVRNAQGTWK